MLTFLQSGLKVYSTWNRTAEINHHCFCPCYLLLSFAMFIACKLVSHWTALGLNKGDRSHIYETFINQYVGNIFKPSILFMRLLALVCLVSFSIPWGLLYVTFLYILSQLATRHSWNKKHQGAELGCIYKCQSSKWCLKKQMHRVRATLLNLCSVCSPSKN